MLSDPEKPFEVLVKKILPFLLKPRECRKGANMIARKIIMLCYSIYIIVTVG